MKLSDGEARQIAARVERVKDCDTREQLDAAQLASVIDFCRDNRLIVGRANGQRFPHTITLCPPLVITRAGVVTLPRSGTKRPTSATIFRRP